METTPYAQHALEKAYEHRDIAVRNLAAMRDGLQTDLAEWAGSNLDSSSDEYRELHEVMVNNGLDGLTRDFNVTVTVSFTVDVTLTATDEDAAREEVEDNLTDYLSDHIDLSYPDDVDVSVYEA